MNTQAHRAIFKKRRARRMVASGVGSRKSKSAAIKTSSFITSDQNTSAQTSFFEKKESGCLSGSSFGVSYGRREQSTDQRNQSTLAAASTVGSIGGNVTLIAGNTYKQVGSDVMAPGGDVIILAKKVDIVEARETSASQSEQKFKQSAITVFMSNPVESAVQSAQKLAQSASQISTNTSGLGSLSASFSLGKTVGVGITAAANSEQGNVDDAETLQ